MTDENPNPLIERGRSTRFKPGQSGNPGGNGPSITAAVKKLLQDEQIMQAFVRSMFKHAIDRGDPRLINLIWDRTDGLQAQKLEITQPMTLSDAILDIAKTEPELLARIRAARAELVVDAQLIAPEKATENAPDASPASG